MLGERRKLPPLKDVETEVWIEVIGTDGRMETGVNKYSKKETLMMMVFPKISDVGHNNALFAIGYVLVTSILSLVYILTPCRRSNKK